MPRKPKATAAMTARQLLDHGLKAADVLEVASRRRATTRDEDAAIDTLYDVLTEMHARGTQLSLDVG